MKKLYVFALAMMVMFALTFAFAGDKSSTMKGWVSDEMCAAKAAGGGHGDCVKKCIEGGKKMVFVNDADKSVVTVANPDTLKGHEGEHVEVSGAVKDGALHVDNVKMLAQAGNASEDHSDMHKQ